MRLPPACHRCGVQQRPHSQGCSSRAAAGRNELNRSWSCVHKRLASVSPTRACCCSRLCASWPWPWAASQPSSPCLEWKKRHVACRPGRPGEQSCAGLCACARAWSWACGLTGLTATNGPQAGSGAGLKSGRSERRSKGPAEAQHMHGRVRSDPRRRTFDGPTMPQAAAAQHQHLEPRLPLGWSALKCCA